jgi:Bacteriophage protein gp37
MNKTKIDWCDSTWNPVTGCLYGCEYCYARKMAQRFSGVKIGNFNGNICELDEPYRRSLDGKINPYPYEFMPTFHRYRLGDYTDKKGRNIFVCSMADLFGSWVPDSWIEEVFSACEKAPQHNYLFLTKNNIRYSSLNRDRKLPKADNMWYGFSITNSSYRIWKNDKFNLFASIEPILEKVNIPTWVNWIIVGAETGRRKDKVIPKKEWIEDILEDCRQRNIPLFMKSSLADIWGEPLIQEFPKELKRS